jgi:hypothetical protein
MKFLRFKPGKRKFLFELGTIVLGVSVALAAQQAADWWRWQSEVDAARAAIRAEMAVNNLTFYAFRVEIAPCMARKTDEAEAVIAALQAHRPPPPLPGFRTGLRSLLNDSEWQTARASQVLTHFPRAEMTLMSNYYAAMQNHREYVTAEGAAWSELSILQDVPDGVATSDLIRLKVSLDTATRMGILIERNSRRALELSERLGLPPTRFDPSRVLSAKNFCSNMSRDEWRRWQDGPEGPRNPMPAIP